MHDHKPTTPLELRLSDIIQALVDVATAARLATGGSGIIDLPGANRILDATMGVGQLQAHARTGDAPAFEAVRMALRGRFEALPADTVGRDGMIRALDALAPLASARDAGDAFTAGFMR